MPDFDEYWDLLDPSKACGNTCNGCGHQGTEPHPCPFLAEIEDDHESLCACCADCEHECAQDT